MAFRGRDSYEDRGADRIVARNQHGSTQRSNILAQTTVHRVRYGREVGSEPYIVGRDLNPLGDGAFSRRTWEIRLVLGHVYQ